MASKQGKKRRTYGWRVVMVGGGLWFVATMSGGKKLATMDVKWKRRKRIKIGEGGMVFKS